MIRGLAVTAAALFISSAWPFAPSASATGSDQTVRVQNGQIRCLLSADYENRGRARAMCVRTDGAPFGISPPSLNVAVVIGSGEMYFEKGSLPEPSDGDVVLGVGQTYAVNGWTITTEELRTLIRNDLSGHGIRVNPVEVAAMWT